MLVEALRMSETLAVAMLNRGYGARPRTTPLKELRMEWGDYAGCGLCLLAMGVSIYLRLRGAGQL